MDLMRARVSLRERTLIDVVDLSVRFCGAHARAYGIVTLGILAPACVVSWAVARLGGWWIGWTAAVVIAAFAEVPFLVLASRLLFEERAPIGTVLRQSSAALPRVAAGLLAELLLLALSAAFLGIPWLFFGPALLFLVEVLVLEKARTTEGYRRTLRIGMAHFGAAMAAAILVGVLRVGGPLVADVAGRELLERVLEIRAPRPAWEAGGSALALFGWWAAVPLVATVRFFEYIDCRTRSEGWDIQMRFAALAARAAAASSDERRRTDASPGVLDERRWMDGSPRVLDERRADAGERS